MSEPAQPVPAGEPVTIQPTQPAQPPVPGQPQGDTNYTEGSDGTMGQDPAPVPAGGQLAEPPAGGLGDQSLAERQQAGSTEVADVPQPEAGPGASDSSRQPESAYPADAASFEAETGSDPYQRPVGSGTSNESAMLPPNLTSGAARAHAALSTAGDVHGNGELSESERLTRLRQIIDFALNELDRFLPSHVRQPAADEVNREL